MGILFKAKSIRKPSNCYYCNGTGIQYRELEERFHLPCKICLKKGTTRFKMHYKFGLIEFEAMICNRYGKRRKTHKWCVEVVFNHIVKKDDQYYKEGYKEGTEIPIHFFELDGWGKSIDFAYSKAIKNVQKYLKDNKLEQTLKKDLNNEVYIIQPLSDKDNLE